MSPSDRQGRPGGVPAARRPPGRRDSVRPEGSRPATRKQRTASQLVTAAPGRALRFADICAGIGGFHLAWQRLGAVCVFAAEKDPAARATYAANFSAVSPELFATGNFARDVEEIDTSTVPEFDVLCAGFPCQPFSTAGRRGGFEDTRGTLFFDIARLLADKRPSAFFLENVRGLVNHDGGRTLRVIEQVVTRTLGYSLHLKVVKACDFGLPQLRARLFMVGFRDPGTPFSFPEPVPLTMTMSDVLGGNCERDIGWAILASGRGKPIETKRSWDGYIVDGKLRRLGTREALQMQGFPDDFVLPASVAVGMRQLGNAVAVPAVEAVARSVAASLAVDVPDRDADAGTPGMARAGTEDGAAVSVPFRRAGAEWHR